jgi:hypothetical protein
VAQNLPCFKCEFDVTLQGLSKKPGEHGVAVTTRTRTSTPDDTNEEHSLHLNPEFFDL